MSNTKMTELLNMVKNDVTDQKNKDVIESLDKTKKVDEVVSIETINNIEEVPQKKNNSIA